MTKLHIDNIRLGFATNSSSTHSLLFMEDPQDLPSPRAESYPRDFGWDHFVLRSERKKAQWLAAHLENSLDGAEMSEEDKVNLITKWLGFDAEYLDISENASPHVDHQSEITLPMTWDGKELHRGFFDCLKSFVLDPRVAVLGGNDNGGNEDGNIRYREILPVDVDSWSRSIVARFDAKYDFWTLFERSNGSKYRVQFFPDGGMRSLSVEKASAPELVDVKITDYCPYECDFCYQGSDKKGQHAKREDLETIFKGLAALEVFEVAIGGGEPTLYPDFFDLLHWCRNETNIVPNFTTRNFAWLKSEVYRNIVKTCAGSWAFSTENPEEVSKLVQLLKDSNYNGKKPDIQYIVGLTGDLSDIQKLTDMCTACKEVGIRLTLLGPKYTNRGSLLNKKFSKEYLEALSTAMYSCLRSWYVGVDTAFIAEFEHILKDLKVSSRSYTKHEGKFSMYIDAVSLQMGPSSYGDLMSMPWTFDAEKNRKYMTTGLVEQFQTW